MSASTFVCAISGQPIPSDKEAVVTPSGRICLKSLLLSKLADNGGSDPFSGQPLDEDQLISLSNSSTIIPPRPSASSVPEILKLLNTEYSNLVLELFDTRKLLEETRMELSQALYQNDAAVRVVARLAMERDAARQELAHWKVNPEVPAPSTEEEGPSKKRARTEASIQPHSIPAQVLETMKQKWQELASNRKALKKEIAAQAPTLEVLQSYKETSHKSYHKSSGKQGIVDMKMAGGNVVTAGKDKKVCVFSGEKVIHTYSFGKKAPTFVDAFEDLVAAASDDSLAVFKDGEELTKIDVPNGIKSVSIHPSQQLVIVATSSRVILYSLEGNELTYFEAPNEIASGSLHPDGLIYGIGTVDGKLSLIDFDKQKLVITLGEGGAAIEKIIYSPNGYHLATIAAGQVTVWDIKKGAKMTELNNAEAAAFDLSAKYLAYGDASGINLTAVKEWSVIVKLETGASNLAWEDKLVSSRDTERAVRFYGRNED
jgi:pre-mRNA-processing factor 19